MARGINKVILVGNLGQDPEMREGGGTTIANLRIATSESYKDRDGNQVDKTEWHTVVGFAKLAEIMGEILHKGDQVYIEGQLQTRQWEDKDGNTRYSTEIRAREMQKLTARTDNGGPSADRSVVTKPERVTPGRPAPKGRGRAVEAFEPDDDLPF